LSFFPDLSGIRQNYQKIQNLTPKLAKNTIFSCFLSYFDPIFGHFQIYQKFERKLTIKIVKSHEIFDEFLSFYFYNLSIFPGLSGLPKITRKRQKIAISFAFFHFFLHFC